MKLLLDENLSPRLAEPLAALYPETKHIHSCGLSSADDREIWQYAKAHGFAIVSKDSDFFERSILDGNPPKIIWLCVGNCSTTEIVELLLSTHALVRTFLEDRNETCLQLKRPR